MDIPQKLWNTVKETGFKISTDTREDVKNKIFLALKGENFDGNLFVQNALDAGAKAVICSDNKYSNESKVFVVEDTIKTLQNLAREYRRLFDIPIIAIGGSNGKTTSRELINEVLGKKYVTHTSKGNFNNHIGLPLSIISMKEESEIAIFEIGANHQKEHAQLLEILSPTHVIVTNNGLDHLEGFGSPKGVREANKEIYDWAQQNKAFSIINKLHQDLVEDSPMERRVLYPDEVFEIQRETPLTFKIKNRIVETNLFGSYNLENIYLAMAVGELFEIDEEKIIESISSYKPKLNRSQIIESNKTKLIVDCYNANPSSMKLALESFFKSTESRRAVILGDMLELGDYSQEEHKKIIKLLEEKGLELVVLIGGEFGKAVKESNLEYKWFPNSEMARDWLDLQNLDNYIVLLKGSRGIGVEKTFEIMA